MGRMVCSRLTESCTPGRLHPFVIGRYYPTVRDVIFPLFQFYIHPVTLLSPFVTSCKCLVYKSEHIWSLISFFKCFPYLFSKARKYKTPFPLYCCSSFIFPLFFLHLAGGEKLISFYLLSF